MCIKMSGSDKINYFGIFWYLIFTCFDLKLISPEKITKFSKVIVMESFCMQLLEAHLRYNNSKLKPRFCMYQKDQLAGKVRYSKYSINTNLKYEGRKQISYTR